LKNIKLNFRGNTLIKDNHLKDNKLNADKNLNIKKMNVVAQNKKSTNENNDCKLLDLNNQTNQISNVSNVYLNTNFNEKITQIIQKIKKPLDESI